ncbi:hypothetical protein GY45DRAFT_601182 [Cubamyces sp. BRFM 1775]|nr:hypothetical protein GY45DRAFT_601182 [Cubamyces sp. BRFM 1775]
MVLLIKTLTQSSPRFNIYIHDYCIKRGFVKTAAELVNEANIPPLSTPPINAKQGLLFEWWSVFWVLFTAKSNGQGPEDALLYTQHQAATQAAAQKPNRTGPAPPRYTANGARPPTQAGPPPNGIGPQGPQQLLGANMPNGAPNSIPFPGNASQANGVQGTSSGPPGVAPPPPQGNAPHLVQGQRPPQRGVNGGQFHSPTMAHSPPNAQGGTQQSNPVGGMGPVGTNPPLTQINNRGNMPPPSGPIASMGTPQHTPQPAYQQLVKRSPSNPGSPASAMTARSPSMSNRQPPMLEMLNTEILRMPPPTLQQLKQEMGLGDKDTAALTLEEKQQLVNHFRRGMKPPNMPGPSAGPSGQPGPSPMQHPASLRTPQMAPNAPPQGQQPLQQQQGQNQQQRGAKRNSTSPGQEVSESSVSSHRASQTGSTSQPEQLPRNESSPPDRKRPRRSPGGEQVQQQQQQQQPPMTPIYPHPSQQPGAPPMQPPHMQQNGLMRGGMPMAPFPGPPMAGMGNPMMGHPLGTPQMSPMNPAMNPAMMGGPPQGGAMGNASMHQYRQAMQNIHKPPHMQQQPMHPSSVASPSASGSQGQSDGSDQQRQGMPYMPGGPPPGNRMGQNKLMSGMLPPPSPATNAKQPGPAQKADGADSSAANGHLDRSPQNAAANAGGQQQQPLGQQQQVQQQPQPGQGPQQGGPAGPPHVGTPAPATPNTSAMTAPSPSAMMGSGPPAMNHPPPPPPPVTNDNLDPAFSLDFGSGLGDFDPNMSDTLFGAESSLNFERDFAAWFDPESANQG